MHLELHGANRLLVLGAMVPIYVKQAAHRPVQPSLKQSLPTGSLFSSGSSEQFSISKKTVGIFAVPWAGSAFPSIIQAFSEKSSKPVESLLTEV